MRQFVKVTKALSDLNFYQLARTELCHEGGGQHCGRGEIVKQTGELCTYGYQIVILAPQFASCPVLLSPRRRPERWRG